MVQIREDNDWTKLVLIPTNSFWCFLGDLDSCLSLQVILCQGGSKLDFQIPSLPLPPCPLHSWLSLSVCPFLGAGGEWRSLLSVQPCLYYKSVELA